MGARDRVQKYRDSGGASDLVRVEVLVPSDRRGDILSLAAGLRADHRQRKQRIEAEIKTALERYELRVLDNIDLERLNDLSEKARVVAHALIERGDARAFAMGRRILSEIGD